MAATQKNQLFDPGFLFTPSESFSLGRTVLPQYKTSQTDRQTTDRRQTTQCTKGTTDSTVGQKILDFIYIMNTGRQKIVIPSGIGLAAVLAVGQLIG